MKVQHGSLETGKLSALFPASGGNDLHNRIFLFFKGIVYRQILAKKRRCFPFSPLSSLRPFGESLLSMDKPRNGKYIILGTQVKSLLKPN
jgi:hypothetical protein